MPNEERDVLVAGTSREEIEMLLPFARAVAGSPSHILVVGLVAVPPQDSLSAGALDARRLREAIEPCALRLGARATVRVGHDVWRELKKVIAEEPRPLVLLRQDRPPPQDWARGLPCEMAMVKRPLPKDLRRILLPIRGGPHAALALRLALALAESRHGEITLLHAVSPAERKTESYQELLAHLDELPQITRRLNVRGEASQSIIAAARGHQLIVMGAIAKPRPDGPLIGPTVARVLNGVRIPTLVVKSPLPWPTLNDPVLEPVPVDYTISVVVDKWFAENTFHAHEFQDLKHLVRLKEQQGLTISLCLPALNEEKTIGKIIRVMRNKFMEQYPLLDEIVVIDSNSTDRTVEIAKRMGIPVMKHSEVLTQYGVGSGKGAALWNSLYILRGDLIAWIDTDIVNIHPRFVYGILGPLIREPHLMYVKGFYQRPLRVGGKLEGRGGGRVTELVARPLLNLFYPELSGFIQPLAGEYAGRRQALEAVPFFGGYGVEIGLLIDLWSRYGLRAMGQVDLEERVHRNQSLMALSKMAFEIIQIIMHRVGQARGVALVNEFNKSMKLVRYARQEFQLDVADIRTREHPPMITIPEYRARRGDDPSGG